MRWLLQFINHRWMSAIFRISVVLFAFGWTAKEVLMPVVAARYYRSEYASLVIRCDQAMNSSWFISQLESPSLSKTELVQMLDCHEYDKLRKLMLTLGVSEDYLALIGLEALEIHQRPASELVELHRFRER